VNDKEVVLTHLKMPFIEVSRKMQVLAYITGLLILILLNDDKILGPS
jgi:hypothetical protein